MRRIRVSAVALAAATLFIASTGCIGLSVRGGDRGPHHGERLPARPGYVEVEGFELGGSWEQDRELLVAAAYVNDTDLTLREVVIWCRAYDTDGYQLGAKRWVLLSSDVGPMGPGFKVRKRLRFRVDPAARVDDVACNLKSAR